MIENVINALAASTPALRERYLQRIRTVGGTEARQIEFRIAQLVEQDRTRAA